MTSVYHSLFYLLFLSISLVLFESVSFAQGTYCKWVDKDGRVHFSNAPPGDAKGATPLGLRDRSEDPRSKRIQPIDELADKLTNLMSQARFLVEAKSNSTANKQELRDVAKRLEVTLQEYETRATAAIASETEPAYRKAIIDASSTTRERVKTYVDLIRKYVDGKDVIDQAEFKKLGGVQDRLGSKIVEDVRIALRNAQLGFNSWRPYKNTGGLVQVGMSGQEKGTF